MSAASFISMAGIIAFMGYDGTVYLMGWTGGYVIWLAIGALLRKFMSSRCRTLSVRATTPPPLECCGDCLILISFHLCRRSNARGRHFFRNSSTSPFFGVVVGMAIFMYAVLGGMKGITYAGRPILRADLRLSMLTIFISMLITGIPIPQIGLGEVADGSGLSVLQNSTTRWWVRFAPIPRA